MRADRGARRVSFVSLHEAANDDTLPPEMAQVLAPAPRTEVMGFAGLSEAAYKSARRRLRRMIGSLTAELREVTQDLLRSAA